MPLRLNIMTPEHRLYCEDVDMVIAPGMEGQLGILPHHAPLIAALTRGVVRVRCGAKEESFAISSGFMEVQHNQVTVLANTAERAEGIDWSRLDGIIVLSHGVFTFADDARTAYERMIGIVTKAEQYLADIAAERQPTVK